jgi:hypothetical protein
MNRRSRKDANTLARGFRPYLLFAAALTALTLSLAFIAPSAPVRAQQAAPSVVQLGVGRAEPALPADGFYVVNDDFKFTIARKYGVMLMRFDGDEEVFVLSVARAPLGGRVLKYDTGDVALRVTGYGGVTIYTSTAPGGLPADRVRAADPIEFSFPALSAVRIQAQQFADKLRQAQALRVTFSIDPSRLDGVARYLVLDTMRNVSRAIRGLCANRTHQAQLAARLRTIRVVRGDKVQAVYRSGVLTLTFAPALGLRGRMSSLALARSIRGWL